MPAESRFAFVEELGNGEERLMLAEVRSTGWGRAISELDRVPGSAPLSDPSFGIPEDYTLLTASRANRYLAALSVQLGLDFIDLNVKVFDLETGSRTLFVNEHRFSGVNRASCRSQLFEDLLQQERDFGVDPAIIAGYDYSLVVEGTSPDIAYLEWTENEKLLFALRLDVNADGFGVLGNETFEFELEPVGAGSAVILSCNAGRRATTPPSASRLSLATVPPVLPFLPPSSTTYIHLDGSPLRFERTFTRRPGLLESVRDWLIYRSPILSRIIANLPWNRGRYYRSAKLVAGYPA